LTPPTSPPARYWAAMTRDRLGHVVLMGGEDASSNGLSDTWTWDGSTWTQVTSPSPPARRGAAMAFDSVRGEDVLFGGYYPACSCARGDTWTWNGTQWTEQGAAPPPAREGAAVAFDNVAGNVMLFGGASCNTSSCSYLNDTW